MEGKKVKVRSANSSFENFGEVNITGHTGCFELFEQVTLDTAEIQIDVKGTYCTFATFFRTKKL